MLIPKNYPLLIVNRDKPMPKQTEALRDIAELKKSKPGNPIAILKYQIKTFQIVDEKFIKTFYPKQLELIMNMAMGGFFGSYELKNKKYYNRKQIEEFVEGLGFSKN
ncbi:hypothetical protein HN954_02825 [bacterium]|jgi:hypothetical protein|nr:hypothetical protein [bacterium]MBT6831432.1 hypothetical protein [bacterium]MBT6996338.1 hypothetical protein [bacterium]MBT7772405.1 hypothetical protein [bacterium]